MKIINIGAIWCPGCLVMKKVWKKITDDYKEINIEQMDYDMDEEEVKKYNPGKILPVIIFLTNDGKEIERLVGEQNEDTIRRKINEYVQKY